MGSGFWFGRRFKSDHAYSCLETRAGVFVRGLGVTCGCQRTEAGQAAPTFPTVVRCFFSFWSLFYQVFLQGRMQARPTSCPCHPSTRELHLHLFCLWNRGLGVGGGGLNGPCLVSESVNWRATSSGMYSHVKHNTCTVCVGRQKKTKKKTTRFPQ